jgi:16S rRNA processing protein RimM
MPASPTDKRVCVARIGAPSGVRGEVRLWSFTADPAAVARYGPLSTADGRVIEIAALKPAKDCFLARLKGVTDRTAAEALRNIELYVGRDKLAPAGEDEYYHADLIGLAAVDTAGAALGTVIAVQNFGAGDILEIAPPRGDTLLVPFSKAAVPEIDVAAGRVVIDPPPGLLGDDEPAAPGGSDAR